MVLKKKNSSKKYLQELPYSALMFETLIWIIYGKIHICVIWFLGWLSGLHASGDSVLGLFYLPIHPFCLLQSEECFLERHQKHFDSCDHCGK